MPMMHGSRLLSRECLAGDASATARWTIDLSAPEAELAASQSAAKKAPAILVSSATNAATRTDVPAIRP